MTLLADAPERAGGERHLPADGGQRVAEGAGDLRRAAAREEEERRDDESVRCRRAAGALRDGASIPNRLLPARLDSRPSAGRGGASAAAAASGALRGALANREPFEAYERSLRVGIGVTPRREPTFHYA